MTPDPEQFKKASAREVRNSTLRSNLAHTLGLIRQRRTDGFAALTDPEGLRKIGNAVKRESLARLPELLERLEEKLISRGIQVHWAESTDEANRIVLEIARRHDVKLVVKGKTMVSEEMGLNDFLIRHGIEVVETDLGEFIVQLAGEPPSHIIAPAIHLNRKQVGQLFADKLGEPLTSDPEVITAMARRVLREKFKQAGMGITGVNFAVADTGTLMLAENEGNGRMCTTAPPVHVALMGLEKVIANLSDLPTLNRLLCLSATGQPISTYSNWLTSPRRPGEKDGPLEMHLLILDNGRSAIYKDAQLRDTLDCIRCAACLNVCPVYTRIGGHAYGAVYSGPIGKILTPQLAGLESAGHLAGASTLCGICQEVCPVNIPIPSLLLRLRQEAHQPTPAGRAMLKGAGRNRSAGEALIWKGWSILNSRPATYRAVTRLARLAAALAPKSLGPLKGWSRHREIPKPARRTLHQLMRGRPGKSL